MPDLSKLLDETGKKILELLQADARLTWSELGRRVGLSQPAAAERVRRLEEAGVITGYHAQVDAALLGLPMLAFIRLTIPPERYTAFLSQLHAWPEVLECHHVSGADSFVLKVGARSSAHLEELIARVSRFGPSTTSLVLSSPKARADLNLNPYPGGRNV